MKKSNLEKFTNQIKEDIKVLLSHVYNINHIRYNGNLDKIYEEVHAFDYDDNDPISQILISVNLLTNHILRDRSNVYLRRLIEISNYASYIDIITIDTGSNYISLNSNGCAFIGEKNLEKSSESVSPYKELDGFTLDQIIGYYTNALTKQYYQNKPVASNFISLIENVDNPKIPYNRLYNSKKLLVEIYDKHDRLIKSHL